MRSENSSTSLTSNQTQDEAKKLFKKVLREIGWTERWDRKEWIISNNAHHPISNIKTEKTNRNWASVTVPSVNKKPITLRVRTEWWNERSKEHQLGLIIHEATHLKVHSGTGSPHRPAFWEICKENYRKIAESERFQDYDWSDVAEFAEEDPNRNCVDRRSESVSERREMMQEVNAFR